MPDRDRKTAAPQRADPERREQARRPRRQPGQRGLNPGQERPADSVASPDDLWPPLMGPGWGNPGSRPHRMPPSGAGRDQRGGRNRLAPALSRADIVDAAIAIADAEGSGAISMRRIAQTLGAGTMSLYWHVGSKEQLLDLMLDALNAEVDMPEPTGDWRADLRTQARSQRAMLLRHDWVVQFLGGRPPLGPNTLLQMERMLAVMEGLAIGVELALNILGTVQTYVLGSVLREMQEARLQREEDRAGITSEAWAPMQAAWRNRLEADGRFTRVVRFLDADIDPDAADTRDERFEFGLGCVIDGIAAKLAAPPGGGPR